jgi:hypothetical protein
MNFIAGVLVQMFTETTAFWVFAHLLECILPIDYFTTMKTAMADQQIFKGLLQAKNPRLSAHLESICIDPSLFSLQWFMCVYSQSVSKKVALN